MGNIQIMLHGNELMQGPQIPVRNLCITVVTTICPKRKFCFVSGDRNQDFADAMQMSYYAATVPDSDSNFW